MRLIEAEQAVIGGIMLDPMAYHRVAEILTEADFTEKAHVVTYRAIRVMMGEGMPIDAITVAEWLESKNCGQYVQGGAYLVDLISNTPSAANIAAYAGIVAGQAEERRVQAAGLRISKSTTYVQAQTLLAEVAPRAVGHAKSVKDGLTEMVDTLQRRFDADGDVTGVPTGLSTLDAITSGWQPGDLVILAGRPGMGKTAFAVQSAIAADRVMFFSLEMTTGQLIERAVCNVGALPNRWFKFPKESPDHAMQLIHGASAKVAKLRMSFEDKPGMSADAIEAAVRQAHMADPLKLIIVDHLGIIGREGKHDASELGAITARMKRIAKEIAPVLLLCQLNRSLESRNDKRPLLSDLRDSGRIEEDADIVIGLYRDSYYTKNTDPDSDFIEVNVLKNRSGEQGTAWGLARLGQMRIEAADEPTGQAPNPSGNGGFASRYGAGGQPSKVSGAGNGR